MAKQEPYMLQRGADESARLDLQHQFATAVSDEHLIHPFVLRYPVKSVADVGTGTGIWLKDVSEGFAANPESGGPVDCVGFDISSEQFPKTQVPGVTFVTHDAAKPFPEKYHAKFDLVHVRLLGYAIRADQLEQMVRNIVQLIKPGGFLDWQEGDAIDAWATPSTEKARQLIKLIVNERVAKGLEPAIVTPLQRCIQNLKSNLPNEQANELCPLTWNRADLMRVVSLRSISTMYHSSPLVQQGKNKLIPQTYSVLLKVAAERRKTMAGEASTSAAQATQLKNEAAEMEQLVDDIAQGKDPANLQWDLEITWIVARKAMYSNNAGNWMTTRFATK